MQVHKFGGSSIGNEKGFEQIFNIATHSTENLIIVVSACGKTTDNLLKAAQIAAKQSVDYIPLTDAIYDYHLGLIQHQFSPQNSARSISFLKEKLHEVNEILSSIFTLGELSPRTHDKLLAYGELISSQLLFQYFEDKNTPSQWIDAQAIIKTNENFTNAKINFEATEKAIAQNLHLQKINIMGGFIASSIINNHPTTLGRGGSDYTAAVMASQLAVADLIIWTDVNGMMTADPRIVPNAITLPELSYQEAMELCHFGAKVIYPPTIIPAMRKNIPIQVKSTFELDKKGTIIKNDVIDKKIVSGLTSIPSVCAITLEGSGMIGIPGFTSRFLDIVAKQSINVIMVTQASSEHGMTMIIMPEDKEKALNALNYELRYELAESIIEPIQCEEELSIVAVVGHNMKNYHGIAGRVFNVLGKNAVNIRAVAQGSSENNITLVIASKHMKKALRVLHEEFFEEQIKEINLFVVGIGTVGSRLLAQIKQQQSYLLAHHNLKINVIGIANSKKMYFDTDAIDFNTPIADLLQNGVDTQLDEFIQQIINLNLGNTLFIDNTASATVADYYETCLKNGIGVITCNKIASSATYERYQNLKKLAKKHKAPYLFETNVGAALPIISTLNDLRHSGDEIHGIKAVLSGSLTYIMNNFTAETSFASVVKKAMEMGYTEPDPRIDLSFLDVKRKILILLREAGYQYELADIESGAFIPESFFEASTVDEFLTLLEENDAHFQALRQQAEKANKKLKIVASYQDGKASVGLEMVDNTASYYHLEGSDNIILCYTDRYKDNPLIIKGAGAGAEVTASGVFADIMRSVN